MTRIYVLLICMVFVLAGCGGGGGSDSPAVDDSLAAPANLTVLSVADGSVTLSWDPVSEADSYNLYYATSAGVTSENGTKVAGATSPWVVSGLDNGTLYYFVVTSEDSVEESGPSTEVTAIPPVVVSATLNDTGIDFFADGTSNDLAAEPADYPGQDASFGRDAQAGDGILIKTGAGVAGFDFTKLDSSGQPLADQNVDYATTPWSCVRDNFTGLIWEVKTTDGGLRDKNNTYTWYSTDAGTANGGSCTGGIDCDTQSYIAAVNAAGLGGWSDWRMPTREELRSIIDYGVADTTIDTDYFPNAIPYGFWSGSSYARPLSGLAWGIFFDCGRSYYYDMTEQLHVLLVRNGE